MISINEETIAVFIDKEHDLSMCSSVVWPFVKICSDV